MAIDLSSFYAVSDTGSVVKSVDGVTWTLVTGVGLPASNFDIHSLVWSPELQMFLIMGSNSSTGGARSYAWDGTTLTDLSTAVPYYISAATWSPELQMFIAVGSTTGFTFSASKCVTSVDGINWTDHSAALNSALSGGGGYANDVIWIPELSCFVVVGGSGAIATSPDGATWTYRATPAANLNKFAWSSPLNLLLLSRSGSYYYSSDAVTWTSAGLSMGDGNSAWSDLLNVFLGFFTNGFLYSSTGVGGWIGKSIWSSGDVPAGIAENGSIAVVIGKANKAHTGTVAGGTWTEQSTPATGYLTRIAYTTPPAPKTEPSGIASEESFGSPTILQISHVSPSGVASSEAVGSPTAVEMLQSIRPPGITSQEIVGSLAVAPGPVTLSATGISSSESVSNAHLVVGGTPWTRTQADKNPYKGLVLAKQPYIRKV